MLLNLDNYCPKGSTLYYSLLYKNTEVRSALITIEAFYQEIRAIVTDFSDIALARIKLQWWREEVEKIYTSTLPNHPISKALAIFLNKYPLTKIDFYSLINGFEKYLDHPLFETLEERDNFFRQTSAIRERLLAAITNPKIIDNEQFLESLAIGLESAFHIINLPFYSQKGHFFFAQQELDKANCLIDDIVKNKTYLHVKTFLANQIDLAIEHLQYTPRLLKKSELLTQSHSIIKASIYTNLLFQIKKSGCNILEQPFDLTPIRKFWIAWRTYKSCQ